MQLTILEFTMYEPPQTDTIGTQTAEDVEPLDSEKPLFADCLKNDMQI